MKLSCLSACTPHPALQIPPPVCRPALSLMAQRNPMAAEHKRITTNTQIGAIKLDEHVKVEMLVSRLKISRHHPNRYPFMAVLESGVTMVELVKVLMVEERLESRVLFRVVERMESRVVPMVEERLESRVLFKVVERMESRVVAMVEERLESRVVAMVEERLGMVGETTSLRFSPGHTSSSSTSESSG